MFFLIFLTITFLLLYLYSLKKLPFAQKWEDFSSTISKIFGLIKSFLTILTILSWSLIACYFACEGIETVVISDLNFLQFPSYIVIGVTIGILSYLMLTIKQMFTQLLPAHKKKSIVWECTRRIIIAPYIAIAGVYLIFYVGVSGISKHLGTNTIPNGHFVFLFSIFAGVFTSTIEEWVYSKVRKILSLSGNEINENSKYDMEKSDFVKLGMNEDLIYRLYYEANIVNMKDLANSNSTDLFDKLKPRYSEKEIQYYIDLAKSNLKYNIENSDIVQLEMNEDLIYGLYYAADIVNIKDLANSNAKELSDKLKPRYSEEKIQKYVDLAKSHLQGSTL